MSFRLVIIPAILFAASLQLAHGETCQSSSPSEFKIELIRLGTDEVVDQGEKVPRVFGDIGVNGQNVGRFYENPSKKIAAGTYKGTLRYKSDHNFVQSSCGSLAVTGDFLLEISGVKDAGGKARDGILFHPGSRPSQSAGCILIGARKFDAAKKPLPLDDDSPLVKIRRAFYGTDTPNACPDKQIVIVVSG